jgi:hypothetical protein
VDVPSVPRVNTTSPARSETASDGAAAERDEDGRRMFRRITALAAGVWGLWWAEGYLLSWIQHKPLTIRMWSHWDAPHYLSIVRDGYVATGRRGLWIVFPPAYPFIAKALALVVRSPLVSALVVSFVASVLAAWFLYRLVRLDGDRDEAWRAVVLLFVFPTAYFLGAPYTESLYLLAVTAAMYFARTQEWGRSSVAGVVATATRVPGIVIVPALAVEALTNATHRFRKLVWSGVCVLGLVAFLTVNWVVHRNPLYFLKVESGPPWFQHAVPPWASLVDAFEQLTHLIPRVPHTAYWTLFARLGAAVFGIVVLLIGRKRLRPSDQVFAWGSLLFFLAASRLISLPRYLLPVYPLYAVLAHRTASRRVFVAIACAGLALQLFLVGRYSQGSWTF